jgi:hypothetical protein
MIPSCELQAAPSVRTQTPTRRARSFSLSLSHGPLFPPLLPREKNPNPRIQNRFCRRIKMRNCRVGQTHARTK